ncbi:VRR-NUC domain-containing protein [Adlercreutzia caecimuris]|uniref:VRR-NUC domain-containing protein n=1 Tax=Adlercreutzia caecimuris TaxID=671266 RepID=UPI0027298C4D|nr:VRR-NUC domain-containing protein [Adlercreutzia caecimuris]
MSEADEQTAVVEWCDAHGVPCFHVPNGGSRHPAEAANLKRQGVRPGVPDLCVPVARCGYHSLWIEMKAPKGRISDAQRGWLDLLRSEGHCAWACFGAESAISLLEAYLSGKV